MRWQHGDVILVSANEIPAGAKKIEIGERFVIEKGEGVHTHVIENTDGMEARIEKKGVLWLKCSIPKTVTHEEHGPKIIPVGVCYKEIENEYDAEADEVRKTQD